MIPRDFMTRSAFEGRVFVYEEKLFSPKVPAMKSR